MEVIVVTLFFIACASAGVLNVSRPTVVTLLDYYKNNKNETRIINGEPASPGQFPWQALAILKTPEGSNSFCGGSLIASKWVLTAAHCVEGKTIWKVKIGGINRTLANETGSVTISSRTVIPHEGYSDYYLLHNIALIKLDSDVEFSDTIQPIRLPSSSEVSDRLEHKKVTFSGYGTTKFGDPLSETLKFVELITLTTGECSKVFGPEVVVYQTLCARGYSPCEGDGGGPLIIISEDGQPTIVGVMSFIVKDARCSNRYPSGYVRTASYLKWINEKTGIKIRD